MNNFCPSVSSISISLRSHDHELELVTRDLLTSSWPINLEYAQNSSIWLIGHRKSKKYSFLCFNCNNQQRSNYVIKIKFSNLVKLNLLFQRFMDNTDKVTRRTNAIIFTTLCTVLGWFLSGWIMTGCSCLGSDLLISDTEQANTELTTQALLLSSLMMMKREVSPPSVSHSPRSSPRSSSSGSADLWRCSSSCTLSVSCYQFWICSSRQVRRRRRSLTWWRRRWRRWDG